MYKIRQNASYVSTHHEKSGRVHDYNGELGYEIPEVVEQKTKCVVFPVNGALFKQS